MKKQLFISGLLLSVAGAFTAHAVPAKPGLITVSTADGSALQVRLVGDENFHQYFSEDGYPLLEKEGNFYYMDYDAAGNVVDSGIKAVNISNRGSDATRFVATVNRTAFEARMNAKAKMAPRKSIKPLPTTGARKSVAQSSSEVTAPPYPMGPGLFAGTTFPAYGAQKAIVILVEYKDVKFNAPYQNNLTANEYFTDMLNKEGFDAYGGTGSAAQYFRENSCGAFSPQFDVYGPLTLSFNQAYYGGNDYAGNDKNPAAMVKEACDQLDATVNFKEYDRDNDGIVDNIYVIYAGRGEASGGSNNTVWPHSWDMQSAGYTTAQCTYDGVRVYTYGCSNEWEGTRPDGVGTFIHEFSHVIGLPDLYATDYSTDVTPGEWSALDYGPYNNDGMTPPLYSAFERYALGWTKPEDMTRVFSGTLLPIIGNYCGIIPTSSSNEFFLVENRQQEGWDEFIPGHGMLIWHIDYKADVWANNRVNNSASHQYVDIEEADGSKSSSTRSGDAFPYGTRDSFTSSTSPAMKTWSGTALDYPITSITETEDGWITFNVSGGNAVPAGPQVSNPTDVTDSGFSFSWENPDGLISIVSVYRLDADAEKEYVPGYQNREVKDANSVTLEDLDSDETYYYNVRLYSEIIMSQPSEEKSAYTGVATLDKLTTVALDADNVAADSFTANWELLEDANDYLLTVYEMTDGGSLEDTFNFDNSEFGDWTSTSSLKSSNDGMYGEKAPALRLGDNKTLTSPNYDGAISAVSFWMRGSGTSEGDKVYILTADGNTELAQFDVVTNEGGTTVTVNNLPENLYRFMLMFNRPSGSGYVAVDDVKVTYGASYLPVALENYNGYSAGNVASCRVEGLRPATLYGYTVTATDGTLTAKPSKLMQVTTMTSSGITTPVNAAAGLSLAGRKLTSGVEMTVFDALGNCVARNASDVMLPAAGVYIVTFKNGKRAAKIAVK